MVDVQLIDSYALKIDGFRRLGPMRSSELSGSQFETLFCPYHNSTKYVVTEEDKLLNLILSTVFHF